MMNSVVPNYSTPGTVFSIISLALVVPVMFMFRQYFRSLQFLQMSYLFGLAMYSTSFSTHLTVSFIKFDHNFFSFCTKGDLVCTLGFQLSFASVLIGFLLLIAIFIGLHRCGNKDLQFQPLYLTFKGLFKWFYLPCTYYSASYLASALDQAFNQSNVDASKIIPAASIGGFCLLFPFWQLIFYKCIQRENTPIWRKWIEFFGYMRLLVTGTLLGLYAYFKQPIYLHCIVSTLIVYPFIFIWKGEFKYPVIQRIIFGFGEAAFLANFFIFKYRTQYIQSYDIDFFFLAFVLSIDVLIYFIRSCRIFIYGVNEYVAVNPENTIPDVKKPQKVQKMNRYDHDSFTNFQNSRETLNVTIVKQPSVSSKKSKK